MGEAATERAGTSPSMGVAGCLPRSDPARKTFDLESEFGELQSALRRSVALGAFAVADVDEVSVEVTDGLGRHLSVREAGRPAERRQGQQQGTFATAWQ